MARSDGIAGSAGRDGDSTATSNGFRNYENQLAQLEQADETVVTYMYAPVTKLSDELRLSKETDAGTVHYVWDNQNIIRELDETGIVEAEYTLNPQPYGNLVSQHRQAESSFYHYDALGSTESLTDSAGTQTDEYVYAAFGAIIASTGTTENLFTWIGEQGYAKEGDDVSIRARIYGTLISRFRSQDPKGFLGGDPNQYRYVQNNPVNDTDPSGLGGYIQIAPNGMVQYCWKWKNRIYWSETCVNVGKIDAYSCVTRLVEVPKERRSEFGNQRFVFCKVHYQELVQVWAGVLPNDPAGASKSLDEIFLGRCKENQGPGCKAPSPPKPPKPEPEPEPPSPRPEPPDPSLPPPPQEQDCRKLPFEEAVIYPSIWSFCFGGGVPMHVRIYYDPCKPGEHEFAIIKLQELRSEQLSEIKEDIDVGIGVLEFIVTTAAGTADDIAAGVEFGRNPNLQTGGSFALALLLPFSRKCLSPDFGGGGQGLTPLNPRNWARNPHLAGKTPLPGTRSTGVRRAKELEVRLVKEKGSGTLDWTPEEIEFIKRENRLPPGIVGHHINDVSTWPDWAGDPRNVRLVRGQAENLGEHCGNFQNPTMGPLIDRAAMLE